MTYLIDNLGDKLYTVTGGSSGRETVILLHGGPGFPDDLLEVSSLLEKEFQLILFHQRGTRKSLCQSANYSMEAYISDIDAIASYFGVTKFHLLGHSWGGLYAQIYAQKHPENLLSLFLCCPGSGTGPVWKQTEKEVLHYNRSKCSWSEWMGMGINSLLGMLGSDDAYKRLFRRIIINYNKGFIEKDYLNIDARNIKSDPIMRTRKEITRYPELMISDNPGYEITIVYGDRDIYGNSKEAVISRFPTARIQTIQGCGHFPWLHNPIGFQQEMERHFHHNPDNQASS